jgi:CBS domain-containing protein
MAQYDEIDRVLDEENPGPSDLESVLAHETLGDVLCDPPLILDSEGSLADALRLMREQRKGCVLVVREGKLAGIFTERDVLMRITGNLIDLERTPVSAYMTRDPVTLPADAGVAFALNKMVLEGFRHIPLVDDDGSIVGAVSMRDIIEYLSDFFRRDILNLPPDPRVVTRKRDGA